MNEVRNAPHLIPLPSIGERRNKPQCVACDWNSHNRERDKDSPLPFSEGEDQDEGLLLRRFIQTPAGLKRLT
jgi:hypothetical protein